jgi:AbrB family looped-hinge helix DNA binding protein
LTYHYQLVIQLVNLYDMKTYLDVDKVGRVVLPKEVRERYGIGQGGRLEIVDTGSGVLLKPQMAAPLVKHLANGFPVFQTPVETAGYERDRKTDDTDLVDLVARSRNERDERNMAVTETAR